MVNVRTYPHKNGWFSVAPRAFAALSRRKSGCGEFWIDGRHFLSEPGEVLFVPAGMGYTVRYDGGESTAVHLTACNYHAFERFVGTDEEIGAKFERLIPLHRAARFNAVKAGVYDILQAIDDGRHALRDEALAACVAYMHRHLFEPITLSDICRVGGISTASLERKFKAAYGMPPKQYCLLKRLEKAVELLTSGEHTVRSAAEQCGFFDEKYFSRAVRRRYGVSPGMLRPREIKNGRF